MEETLHVGALGELKNQMQSQLEGNMERCTCRVSNPKSTLLELAYWMDCQQEVQSGCVFANCWKNIKSDAGVWSKLGTQNGILENGKDKNPKGSLPSGSLSTQTYFA